MNKPRYIIVRGKLLPSDCLVSEYGLSIERLVNEKIGEGYAPIGAPILGGGGWFFQAMNEEFNFTVTFDEKHGELDDRDKE
jgi:hypothetical protein